MFQVGEYVVYGVNGICRVEEICPSPYDRADTRLFYLLIPIETSANSDIYTPVGNEFVPMRRLMTKEDVAALLVEIPAIPLLEIKEEKQRREIYRAALGDLDPRGYVRVIKTVQRRRVELSAVRKHFPITDLEYGRLAKHLLYSECAHVLGMREEDMENYFGAYLRGEA